MMLGQELQSPALLAARKELETRQAEVRRTRENINAALDEAARVAKNLESIQIPAARAAIRAGKGSWITLAKLMQRQEMARDFSKQREPLLRGVSGEPEVDTLKETISSLSSKFDKYQRAKRLVEGGVDAGGNLRQMKSLSVALGLEEHFRHFSETYSQTEDAA